MAIEYSAAGFLEKIRTNNNSYVSSYKKRVREANTGVETLQEDIADFRKCIRNLKNYSSGVTPKSKVERQLKDFVKSYNSMKKNSADVTDEKLSKQLSKLENLFSEHEKDLKKIGLKQSDGKLEFDTDVFEEDEDKVVDKVIGKLFSGKDSFIRQADKIMRGVESSADDAEYSMVERRLSKTTTYSDEDILLGYSYALTMETISALKKCSELIDGVTGKDKNEVEGIIKDNLTRLCQYANSSEDKTGVSEKILELCIDKDNDNESKFSSIGITTINSPESGYSLKYTDSIDLGSNEYKKAFSELFGKDAKFGNAMVKFCEKGYNNVIKPENLGVSIIIDKYA